MCVCVGGGGLSGQIRYYVTGRMGRRLRSFVGLSLRLLTKIQDPPFGLL